MFHCLDFESSICEANEVVIIYCTHDTVDSITVITAIAEASDVSSLFLSLKNKPTDARVTCHRWQSYQKNFDRVYYFLWSNHFQNIDSKSSTSIVLAPFLLFIRSN